MHPQMVWRRDWRWIHDSLKPWAVWVCFETWAHLGWMLMIAILQRPVNLRYSWSQGGLAKETNECKRIRTKLWETESYRFFNQVGFAQWVNERICMILVFKVFQFRAINIHGLPPVTMHCAGDTPEQFLFRSLHFYKRIRKNCQYRVDIVIAIRWRQETRGTRRKGEI